MLAVVVAQVFKVYDSPRQIGLFGLPLVDVIGSLSFLIILITLYASLKAAKESARANMLNSLPLLTLAYDHDKDEVIVENNGNGVAVNVKVDSFYNWWSDKDFNLFGLTKVIFKRISILKHNDKAVLETETKGVIDLLRLTKFIMFSKNRRPLTFAIQFSDLSGQRYITKIRIWDSKVEIVSSPKNLNLINRLRFVVMRVSEKSIMVWYFVKTNIAKYMNERESKKKQ